MSNENILSAYSNKTSQIIKMNNNIQQHISKPLEELHKSDFEDEDYSGLAFKPSSQEKTYSSCEKRIKGRQKKGSCDQNDFKTKWKTEICHYWEMNGYCQYGNNCAFAHGLNDIRNRKMSANYKTKPCKQFFINGFCPYGTRCQFSHKSEPTLHPMSYLSIISDFLKSEKIDESVLKRPRLMTFETLVRSDQNIKENRLKLFEDILKARKDSFIFDERNQFALSNSQNENNSNQRSRIMSL